MNAHVEEAGMLSQLSFVLGDDRIGRVCDRFIIESPSCELRSRRCTGCKSDVIALPRIRLAEFDLPLRIIAKCRVSRIAGTGVNLPVSKGPSRPRQRVDEVPA